MHWQRTLARLNPVVPRNWLLALAGLMWSAVGVLLCSYAWNWVTHPATRIALALGVLGLAISVVINLFGFSKLAKKNIARIMAYDDRACAFAFQAWQGWLIVVVMMSGGMLLRQSGIPRPYLAVVYAGIGAALLQASLQYYVHLGRLSLSQPQSAVR